MLKNGQNNITLSLKFRIFIPFALAFFMSNLFRSINSVLAPTFTEQFNMSGTQLAMMTSAYFFSFALVQIPIGVSLDRFGASKTLSAFILFAVAGSVTFSYANSVSMLLIGRALVGIGVAGCLMSALKSFNVWFDKKTAILFNSWIGFVGGVGGIVSTKPIVIALDYINWRQLFLVLGGLTLLIAISIAVLVPLHPEERNKSDSIGKQFSESFKIMLTGKFWRLAPIAIFGQATYLAFFSLWIGPWYRDVAGKSAESIPNLLLICSVMLAIGYLINGYVARILNERINLSFFATFILAMSLMTLCMVFLAFIPSAGTILWPAFLVLGPFSVISYPIFANMFDTKYTGRVQTAYNMLVFISTTVIQTAIGKILDLSGSTGDGTYNPSGYTIALLAISACFTLSILWALFFRRSKKEINY